MNAVIRNGEGTPGNLNPVAASPEYGILSTARGAHPVRGKGRAHPPKTLQGYEPSFSLIRADSRHTVRGDSYV